MCEISEEVLVEELKNLLKNARIRPEPEYQCMSKYLATFSTEEFLQDEHILQLINCHGVQLRNDIKYWLDKNNLDNKVDPNKPVPILDPKHFVFKNFNDVVDKLKELPSEWTIVQITKKFSIDDIMEKVDNKKLPGVHITRFACGNLAERIHPYSVMVNQDRNSQENIFKTLTNLVKMRREYYSLGRTSKKLWNAYYKTNSDLMSFIKEMELYVLKQWICLFNGRLEDNHLEKEILNQVNTLIETFCKKEKLEMPDVTRLDVLYQMTLSAHFMKQKAIFSVLKSTLYNDESPPVNVPELSRLVENIKLLNLSKDCAIKRADHYPVILILDNEFEMVPWEMISPLSGRPVCRISSLHLLYALFKYHQPYIKNGFRTIEIDNTYCLINPSKDLESCEKEMKEFLKKRIPWAEVDVGQAPGPKDLIAKFVDVSAFVYCGHGTGMQYLDERELKRSFVKGLVLLFGCSSNIPKNAGGRTPHLNNTYTYISNGCPCVVGCIQDVGSTDADEACKEMLNHFMPSVRVSDTDKTGMAAKEPNVLKALVAGKNACSRYWSKSAFVARGIPCKTAPGDKLKLHNS